MFPLSEPLSATATAGAELFLRDCPSLPVPSRPLTAASIGEVGTDRGPAFYRLALECAQALWRAGVPAQSLLLVNRAFGADLRADDAVLAAWPLPYRAVRWILENRRDGQFIGNPRRHYQHLATRMVEPRRELRAWRAWACWAIARHARPDDPADDKQCREEGVREPGKEEIERQLARLGLPGEAVLWRGVVG